MNKPEINASLLQQDLFELFRQQLKKDFETSGCNTAFTDKLPVNYTELKNEICNQLKKSSALLQGLLYRIDVSEQQIKRLATEHPAESYEDLIAELIIKRTLQKVILKKTYNKK